MLDLSLHKTVRFPFVKSKFRLSGLLLSQLEQFSTLYKQLEGAVVLGCIVEGVEVITDFGRLILGQDEQPQKP